MERTDVKNNHTEEYSTGQIRCIEKSDNEAVFLHAGKALCKRQTS